MSMKVKTFLVAVALSCAAWVPGAAQAPEQAEGAAASAEQKAAAPAARRAGREKRDPFVSPVVARPGGVGTSTCVSGKRCLVIGQVTLKGVVRAETGMIAVVENAARRVYFLREKDPLFDGQVVRIMGDAIVLQENVTDAQGRQATREVVKRVG
jgi:hypothetical protein